MNGVGGLFQLKRLDGFYEKLYAIGALNIRIWKGKLP